MMWLEYLDIMANELYSLYTSLFMVLIIVLLTYVYHLVSVDALHRLTLPSQVSLVFINTILYSILYK
jgi:hypothetical protein